MYTCFDYFNLCNLHCVQDGETRVRVELRPIDEKQTTETAPKAPTQQITDTSPVESFLSGENCLQGVSWPLLRLLLPYLI